jgi:hypothetical protein
LEIVALGAMNLAILLAGVFRPVSSRQGLAGGAPGKFLAGVVTLGLLGGAGVAGFLNSKHGLAFALLVPPPVLPWRGCSVFFRFAPCANSLAREFPSFFSPSALVGQSVKLGNTPDFVHRQLFPHFAVTHVLIKREAPIPDDARIAALGIELSPAKALDGVRAVMIPMPRAFDALKAIQPRGWAVDPSHPDLDAVHEAEILAELYGKLVELPPEPEHGADYQGWMLAGRTAADELRAALTASRAGLAPTDTLQGAELDRADAAFKAVGASCKSCHAVYRD